MATKIQWYLVLVERHADTMREGRGGEGRGGEGRGGEGRGGEGRGGEGRGGEGRGGEGGWVCGCVEEKYLHGISELRIITAKDAPTGLGGRENRGMGKISPPSQLSM